MADNWAQWPECSGLDTLDPREIPANQTRSRARQGSAPGGDPPVRRPRPGSPGHVRRVPEPTKPPGRLVEGLRRLGGRCSVRVHDIGGGRSRDCSACVETCLVITAVSTGTSPPEVARTHGMSQGWISQRMTRSQIEGDAALKPRSRRPWTSPRAVTDSTVELIVRLRKELSEQVSRSTIRRPLAREGRSSRTPRSDRRTPTSCSPPSSPAKPGSHSSPTGSPVPTTPRARRCGSLGLAR